MTNTGAIMTVYIEYVLIDNFVIDYLLLKATFLLTKLRSSKGRLLFCAFLGSVFALLYPLLTLSPLLITLLKLAFGLFLVLISGEYKTKKEFLVCALIFNTLTFLLGGGIIGVFNLLGLDYSSEWSIGLMILPVYALLKIIIAVVKHVYARKDIERLVYDCEIKVNQTSLKIRGFLDTGNMLFDGDTPVVVCDKRLLDDILDGGKLPRTKKITYSTVGGVEQMIAIERANIKIYFDNKANTIENVTLGFVKSVGTGYDVILHPALWGRNDEFFGNDKKIS